MKILADLITTKYKHNMENQSNIEALKAMGYKEQRCNVADLYDIPSNHETKAKILPIQRVRRMLRLDTKKLYKKRVYVANLGGKYWYTAEVRRLGFLWRGKWKELTPTMQPTYEDAVKLFSNYA